jgi:hypothetical protein
VDLQTQLVIEATIPGGSVPAGATAYLDFPPTSSLATLYFWPSHLEAWLTPVNSSGEASGSFVPVLTRNDESTGWANTVAIPADVPAGRYRLVAVTGGTGTINDYTVQLSVDLEVTEPEAPAPMPAATSASATPALNPGLRSETGGNDGSSPLLPIALSGVVVLAAAGVVVRTRRQPADGA